MKYEFFAPAIRRLMIITLLIFGRSTIPIAAGEIFNSDQALLAALRVPSLRNTNDRIVRFWRGINPFYAHSQVLLDHFAARIYNDRLLNVETDNWVEAVLLTLPSEPAGWVYAFNVSDERKYLADLLAVGDVRQETQGRGVTRYRLSGARNAIFYLTFIRQSGSRNALALLGSSQNTVERARGIYSSLITNGLLADRNGSLAFSLHSTRFHLNYPRFLPNFLEMLRYDLITDLAGVTSKSDNPLAIFLAQINEALIRFCRNLAIVHADLSFTDEALIFNSQIALQYGGTIHYALNAQPADLPAVLNLPAAAQFFAVAKLWSEESEQIWESLGAAIKEIFPSDKREVIAAAATPWYELLCGVDWQGSAGGIVAGDERCGAVLVALLKAGAPEKLAPLWQATEQLAQTSAIAETLSENGIKFSITADTTDPEIIVGQKVYRAAVEMSSLNFALPETFAGTHRYLVTLIGDTLAIVAPATVLVPSQYRDAEKHLLAVMTETIKTVTGELPAAPAIIWSPEIFFAVSFNPLRFAQLAFQNAAVWTPRGEPNRLPIPWNTYYNEIKDLPAAAAPLRLTIGNNRNSLIVNFSIPTATVAEFAAAFLNFRASEKK